MTIRAVLMAMFLVGCLPRPIEQTTITQLREQDAVVMPPQIPLGVGTQLQKGASSLGAGAALTSTQALSDTADVGQAPVPFGALLRGAVGASDRVDVGVSADASLPAVDVGPFGEPTRDDTKGALLRGTLDTRMFVPLEGSVEWGFDLALGVEGSLLRVTDTTTLEVRDRFGTTTDSWSSEAEPRIRLHPHGGFGSLVRMGLPGLPVTPFARFGVQTWPVYWGSATKVDTCTTYTYGESSCVTTGNIPNAPSPVVAVWTASGGATLAAGEHGSVHVQGFAHFGPEAVGAVPWGAMVFVEGRTP